MPHLPNWQEFGNVGQDKPSKDAADVYDSNYGTYKCNVMYSSKQLPVMKLPAEPKPFDLKG